MQIEDTIQAIRDSFVGAEHVYMNGSCYYFAKILHSIYPDGKLHETRDHVYFEYDHGYYDIRGLVNPPSGLEEATEPTKHGKYDLVTELIKRG